MKEQQVPKVIHMMWFSGDEYPQSVKACLKTWEEMLPEYKIKVWTKEMALACGYQYIDEAIDCKKWAFAADVMRLYALYTEGGVYMDSDIIVKKPLDDFLYDDVTLFQEWHEKLVKKLTSKDIDKQGFRQMGGATTGIGIQAAFMIAKKGNPLIKHILDYYIDQPFIKADGEMAIDLIAPTIFAKRLEKYGYRYINETQELVPGFKVLPSYFVAGGIGEFDKRNYAIHACRNSWRPKSKLERIKELLKKPLNTILGRTIEGVAKR